jgi:pimeloyl-ACP methyl ester carboxylesterase
MKEIFRDPISAHHASYSERKISVDEDVNLRAVSWQPKNDEAGCPVVFVAGWVSVVAGWAEFLHSLTEKHPVYYIETREKKSAEIKKSRLRTADFRMDRFAQDVITVCSELPIDMEEAVVSGSSLGATVLLEALKHQRLKAKGAFLIGPASEFRIPRFLAWMPYLFPSPAYYLVRHFIVWYFRHFRVNVKEEPEQMRRYRNTILSAHPLRIKLSGRAFMRYQVWPDLETVQAPTRIAYASSDKLHASETISRMANTIQQADLLPCESNKYMHSAPLADDVCKCITDIETSLRGQEISSVRESDRTVETSRDFQEPTVTGS